LIDYQCCKTENQRFKQKKIGLFFDEYFLVHQNQVIWNF